MASDLFQNADRLMDEEVRKLQGKLARVIVVFMELLHLLIARNRDLLLNVIQERRKDSTSSFPPPPTNKSAIGRSQSVIGGTNANSRGLNRPSSYDSHEKKGIIRSISEDTSAVRSQQDAGDDQSQATVSLAPGGGAGNVRTDSAIAVQSELQRAFISLAKALYPGVSGIIKSDTPRWLKQCCQENYFSLGTYRHTRIRKNFFRCLCDLYFMVFFPP